MKVLEGLETHVASLDSQIRNHPEYADLLNLRGLAHACVGRLEAALADFTAALRCNPNYASAGANLIWLHGLRNETGGMAALMRGREFQGFPAEIQHHCEFLRQWHTGGPTDAQAFLHSTSTVPTGRITHLDLMFTLVTLHEWKAAKRQLDSFLASHGQLEDELRKVGLHQITETNRSLWQDWARLYRGNPGVGNLPYQWALSFCHRDAQKFDELVLWGLATSLDLSKYYLTIGTRDDIRGDDQAALRAFGAAKRSNPANPQPPLRLGLLHASLGQARAAIAELEAAVDLAPDYADVRYLLAQLYQEQGYLERAESQYQLALSLNPNYALARLALGSLLERQHRDAEALPHLEGALAAGVDSADLVEMLARLYERTGRHEAAQRARKRLRVIASQPDS